MLMSSKRDKTNYQTLADFARLVGVDRTTVLAWVRSGKIKSKKKGNSKRHHRLCEHLFYRYSAKKFKKPYPKYSTTWSETEIYVLRNWEGTDEQLVKPAKHSGFYNISRVAPVTARKECNYVRH